MKKRGRGRPKGTKLTKTTKNKISRSRTGKRHSKETKAKISISVNKNGRSVASEFVPFALTYISTARRTNRNPIMTEIIRSFIDTRPENEKPDFHHVKTYGVEVRKSLELRGYISYAAPNAVDRRVRFVTPTPLFPDGRATRQLRNLTDQIMEDIREYIRRCAERRRARS